MTDISQSEAKRARGRRATPAWMKLAAVVGSFAICGLAAEISLFAYHVMKTRAFVASLPEASERALVPSGDPALIVEFNPGFARDGFTINAHGMPDDPVEPARTPGVVRIALFGDSVSANFALEPRDVIFPTRLEELLAARGDGRRYEVLNFGVNSYSLLQSLRNAELRDPIFHPDVIVVQLCLNDPHPTPLEDVIPPTSTGSRALDAILRRLAPERFWLYDAVLRHYDASGWHNIEAGLRGFASLAGERPLLAVLFPLFDDSAYAELGVGDLHAGYAQRAREAGVPLLDLYDAFERAGALAPPHPLDRIHPDASGHRLAAEEIARALSPALDRLRVE